MNIFGSADLDANMVHVDRLTSKEGKLKLAEMIRGCLHSLWVRERNLFSMVWESDEVVSALRDFVKRENFELRLAFHIDDNKEEALKKLIHINTRLSEIFSDKRNEITEDKIKLYHWESGYNDMSHLMIGDMDYCVVVETHNSPDTTDDKVNDTCGRANFLYFDSDENAKRSKVYTDAIENKGKRENNEGVCDVMVKYDKSDILDKLDDWVKLCSR